MKAQRDIEEEQQKKNKKKNKKKQEEQKEESEESKFFKYIENKSEGINYLLLKYYFNFIQPSDLAKNLFEIITCYFSSTKSRK